MPRHYPTYTIDMVLRRSYASEIEIECADLPKLDNPRTKQVLTDFILQLNTVKIDKAQAIHLIKLYHWCPDSEIDDGLKSYGNRNNRNGLSFKDMMCLKYGSYYANWADVKNTVSLSTANRQVSKNPRRSRYELAKIEIQYKEQGKEISHRSRKCKHSVDYWILRGYDRDYAIVEAAIHRKIHGKKSVAAWEEAYKNRHGGENWEEDLAKLRSNHAKKCFSKNPQTYSGKEATRVLTSILNQLDVLDHKFEYIIRHNDSYKFYDLMIKTHKGNFLLEYDGVAWHAIPGYEHEYRGYVRGISIDEVRARDKFKDELAELHGFKIIRITDKMSKQEAFNYVRSRVA